MTGPFLTARWTNLVVASYAVAPALCQQYLPPGVELDEHPAWPGRGIASVVAFMFRDCRVRGVRFMPSVRLPDFPEVNLRTYVRGPRGRGVLFIRELVPSRFVRLAAAWSYCEPFGRAPMRRGERDRPGSIEIDHEWRATGRVSRVSIAADSACAPPAEGSIESFLCDQRWAYGRDRRGRTTVFEARHRPWGVHRIRQAELSVRFGACFGQAWEHLERESPASVFLAAGSAVEATRPVPVMPVDDPSAPLVRCLPQRVSCSR